MTMDIPENVLAAIRALVEHWRSFDPDDEDIVVNRLPLIDAWFERLGLPPVPHPSFPEEET